MKVLQINTLSHFKKLCLGFLLSVVVCCIGCGEKTDKNGQSVFFHTSPYYYEYYRIPLKFPFELRENYFAGYELMEWDNYNTSVLNGILRFALTNGCLYGTSRIFEKSYPTDNIQYFIYSFAETNIVIFPNLSDFTNACVLFGGDVANLKSCKDRWIEYWGKYDSKRRK